MSARAMDARNRSLAFLLSALALAVLFVLASFRGSFGRVSGDEGTYLAMAESLAKDLNLTFEEADEERITTAEDPGRRAVILQRTDRGISYSKPFLIAFVTAPFYALFGRNGPVVANMLLLAAALSLLWMYLRRVGDAGAVALTTVTFAATGALLPYALWRTSDVLQAALALAGLVLCLGSMQEGGRTQRRQDLLDRHWAPLAGAVMLGLLIALRPPNALVAGIAPAVFVVQGEWRRLGRFLVTLAVTLVAIAAVSWALFGTVMPYKAERATFNLETGFPAGEDAADVVVQFERGRATSSLDATPEIEPRVSAWASIYFFMGRHTGVLVYFPATLFLVLSVVRRSDRTGLIVIGAVTASALFFLLWLPFNYFGGGSCIGNRYFLVSYAALPLALRRPLSRGAVAASWLLALVVGGSAVLSEWRVRELDSSSQSHANAGIFRVLPYESTASDLEGSRDRYFGKDFVRAVDPFVKAWPWSFTFTSDLPPAEIVLANLERDDPLRLLVHSSARDIELFFEDHGGRQTIPLSRPVGQRGLVEIQPSRPVRFHPLWFRNPWDHGKPYWVRVFRLGVRSKDGRRVEANVRILGREEFPPRIFERTVISAELPARARAGSVSEIEVKVRNDNRQAWRSDRLFPVFLSYRLEPVDDAAGPMIEGPRTRLPAAVVPSGELELRLDVVWPMEPGRYHLRVDLVAEGVSWFERRSGAPLAQGTVEIVASDEDIAPRAAEDRQR